MIYYQTEGGPVISDKVSGGQRETHSLDGLQRGVTYNISILALSQHLPSPLVGPVSVDTSEIHTSLVAPFLFYIDVQLLLVETSPQSLPVGYHNLPLTCTVRVEADSVRIPQPMTIHWTVYNTKNEPLLLKECSTTIITAPKSCVVNINETQDAIYYHCTAKYSGLTNFSDITVNQEGQGQFYFSYLEIYVLLFTFTVFSPLSHTQNITSIYISTAEISSPLNTLVHTSTILNSTESLPSITLTSPVTTNPTIGFDTDNTTAITQTTNECRHCFFHHSE